MNQGVHCTVVPTVGYVKIFPLSCPVRLCLSWCWLPVTVLKVACGTFTHSRNTRKASVIFREKARVFTRAFFRVRSHRAKPSLWWPLETQRRNLYNSFTAPINFWRCIGIRMDHLRATYGVLNISLSPSSVRKTTCFLTIYESKCIATPKKNRKIWRK